MDYNLVWQKPGREKLEDQSRIIHALVRSGTRLTVQHENLEFLFVANMPETWRHSSNKPPSDASLFGDELAARLESIKTDVLKTGNVGKLEASDSSGRIYEFVVEIDTRENRQPVLITTIIDLTEERRREIVLKSLLREVSHRSKNMLAIVQSIANQTARTSDNLKSFLTTFRGRIQSLSFSQDIVTEARWRGADLHELINRQIELYVDPNLHQIRIIGPSVELTPNGATNVGLAIHELVVNAASRGSLGKPNRSPIDIFIEQGRDDMLILRWKEPLAASQSMRDTLEETDFNSVILTRVVPQSLSGSLIYHIDGDDLIYELCFNRKN